MVSAAAGQLAQRDATAREFAEPGFDQRMFPRGRIGRNNRAARAAGETQSVKSG